MPNSSPFKQQDDSDPALRAALQIQDFALALTGRSTRVPSRSQFRRFDKTLRADLRDAESLCELIAEDTNIIFSLDLCELVDASRLHQIDATALASTLGGAEDLGTVLSDAVTADESLYQLTNQPSVSSCILPGTALELMNYLAIENRPQPTPDYHKLLAQGPWRDSSFDRIVASCVDAVDDENPTARAGTLGALPEVWHSSNSFRIANCSIDGDKELSPWHTQFYSLWMNQLSASRKRHQLSNICDASNLALASAFNVQQALSDNNNVIVHMTKTPALHREIRAGGLTDTTAGGGRQLNDAVLGELRVGRYGTLELKDRTIPIVVTPRAVLLFLLLLRHAPERAHVPTRCTDLTGYWLRIYQMLRGVFDSIDIYWSGMDHRVNAKEFVKASDMIVETLENLGTLSARYDNLLSRQILNEFCEVGRRALRWSDDCHREIGHVVGTALNSRENQMAATQIVRAVREVDAAAVGTGDIVRYSQFVKAQSVPEQVRFDADDAYFHWQANLEWDFAEREGGRPRVWYTYSPGHHAGGTDSAGICFGAYLESVDRESGDLQSQPHVTVFFPTRASPSAVLASLAHCFGERYPSMQLSWLNVHRWGKSRRTTGSRGRSGVNAVDVLESVAIEDVRLVEANQYELPRGVSRNNLKSVIMSNECDDLEIRIELEAQDKDAMTSVTFIYSEATSEQWIKFMGQICGDATENLLGEAVGLILAGGKRNL